MAMTAHENFLHGYWTRILKPGEQVQGVSFATQPGRKSSLLMLMLKIFAAFLGLLLLIAVNVAAVVISGGPAGGAVTGAISAVIAVLAVKLFRSGAEQNHYLVLTNQRLILIRSGRAGGGVPALRNLGVVSIPRATIISITPQPIPEHVDLEIGLSSGRSRRLVLNRADGQYFTQTVEQFVDTLIGNDATTASVVPASMPTKSSDAAPSPTTNVSTQPAGPGLWPVVIVIAITILLAGLAMTVFGGIDFADFTRKGGYGDAQQYLFARAQVGLASGIVVTIIGAGLLLLSIVGIMRRRAASLSSTRSTAPVPNSDVSPRPVSRPEQEHAPSSPLSTEPPTRDAAPPPQSDIPSLPESPPNRRPGPCRFPWSGESTEQKTFLEEELPPLLQPGEQTEGIGFATNTENHFFLTGFGAIGALFGALFFLTYYLIYRLFFDKSFFLVLTDRRLILMQSKRTAFVGRPRPLNLGVTSIPLGEIPWAEVHQGDECRNLELVLASGERRYLTFTSHFDSYLTTPQSFVDVLVHRIQSQPQPGAPHGGPVVGAKALSQDAPQGESPTAPPTPARRVRPANLPPDPAKKRAAVVGLVALAAIMLVPLTLLGLVLGNKFIRDLAESTPDVAFTPPPIPTSPPKKPDSPKPASKKPSFKKPEPKKPAFPPPSVPAPPAEGEQYLRDLVAAEVVTIANREFGIDHTFTVGKVKFEQGVFLHPPGMNSSAEASYWLAGGYKQLRGAVGVGDHIFGHSFSPLTFTMLGDGRELWRSREPIAGCGKWEAFDVDVTGVNTLTLTVSCPGMNNGGHGGWLDPILVRSASGPTPAPAELADPVAKAGEAAPVTVINEGELKNLARFGAWRHTESGKKGTLQATWRFVEGENQIQFTRDDNFPAPVLTITKLQNGRITIDRRDVVGIAAGIRVTYLGSVQADGSMEGITQVQHHGEQWEGKWTAQPMPTAPVPPSEGEQYLRELAATDVKTISDKVNHAIDRSFTVCSVPFEHGVYLHPPFLHRPAEASYELAGDYQRLRGAVGISDHDQLKGSATPLTFRLLGDGEQLWRSLATLQTGGNWETFDVDVTGVERLTLKVDCPGHNAGAHAAWLDPILVRAAPGTSPTPVASAEPVAGVGAPTELPTVINEEELRNLERIGAWRQTEENKNGRYHGTWTIVEGKNQIRFARDDRLPAPVLTITGLQNGRITIDRKEATGHVAGMRVTYVGNVTADGSIEGVARIQYRGDSWGGTWTALSMPPAPAPPSEGQKYLRDLPVANVSTIADKRSHPIDRSFSVRKVSFEHGVYLHPPAANSSAEASYFLEGYERLQGAVGMIDQNIFGRSATPLTYKLLGDGEELWHSRALQSVGEWESFEVDVTGVKRLTLKVDCPGLHTGAGAAWLDPILVRSAPIARPVPGESVESP